MKFAKLVEDISFPSNVSTVSAIILIFYFWNSPFTINHIIAFIVPLFIYKLSRKFFLNARTETKKFTYPSFLGLATFLVIAAISPLERGFLLGGLSFVVLNLITHVTRDFWKISTHTMNYTTVATILSLIQPLFIFSFVLLPLVIWSRIKLKRHTPKQIVVGFLVGLAVPLIILSFI